MFWKRSREGTRSRGQRGGLEKMGNGASGEGPVQGGHRQVRFTLTDVFFLFTMFFFSKVPWTLNSSWPPSSHKRKPQERDL